MLTIVIPMAGRGQRFIEAGYSLPKPLLPVHGHPMVQCVIDNLRPTQPHRFIFLALREHLDQYNLADSLREWAPDCRIITVDHVTEGAACTVLLARAEIASGDPLMIANADQWVVVDIDHYLMSLEDNDGLIMTMQANDPKWSYVGFDSAGKVDRIVEKQVISDAATVGIYNFARGGDFISAAESMIAQDLKVRGEFYVAPVFNQLLATGGRVCCYSLETNQGQMHGLGSPKDYEDFIASEASRQAVRNLT